MPILITEFRLPALRDGARLPLAPLPEQDHHEIAAGADAIQLGAETRMIAITPDAAIRIKVADTEAGADEVGAGSLQLAADTLREFEVTPGHWLKTVAA